MQACNVKGICFAYQKDTPVLKDCSFSIEQGEIVALLGANGCGKSTLFSCMTASLKFEGEITLFGDNLKKLKARALAQRMSYLPQICGIEVSISLLDVVCMGFNSALSVFASPKKQQIEQAVQLLTDFGLADKIYNDFLTLSGGERQLGLFARALVGGGNFLLLDEPASALDVKNKFEVLTLLREQVKKQGKTALLSIHDPTLAFAFCDRVLMMQDGKILADFQTNDCDMEQLNLTMQKIYGNINIAKIDIDGAPYYTVFPKRQS